MSTKKIREALELVDHDHPNTTKEQRQTYFQAMADVESIEIAARAMRALAPGEMLEAFNADPLDPKVMAWLRGYELLLSISQEAIK